MKYNETQVWPLGIVTHSRWFCGAIFDIFTCFSWVLGPSEQSGPKAGQGESPGNPNIISQKSNMWVQV